jgi:REP element-mobilizing transposase RayT
MARNHLDGIMPYDPNRHNRQSIRLRGYDYTQPGAYFVTICTHARQCLFDNSALRRIAEQQWRRMATKRIILDAWVVMPDHVHGIIVIAQAMQQAPGSSRATPIDNGQSRNKPALSIGAPAAPLRNGIGINVTPGSLGAIIRSYKASVTRRTNHLHATPGAPIWQRGYWERIVRSDRELLATRHYIAENPRRWAEDREDLDALLARMEEQG